MKSSLKILSSLRRVINLKPAIHHFSTSSVCISTKVIPPHQRTLGQPSHFTHPQTIKQNEVTPRISKKEYEGRRLRLLYKLKNQGDKHVVIINGNQMQYMSEDIPYPFHQKNNFLYFTGFLEPDSCLVMEADFSREYFHTTLLVPHRDVKRELWNGPRSGVDGALYLTGVDKTDLIENLSEILDPYVKDNHTIWCDQSDVVNTNIYHRHVRPFLESVLEKERPVKSLKGHIQELRVVKSENEINLLGEACYITGEAFKQAMPTTQAGMNERVLQALIDCECRLRGAQILAYPPVVAGGNRGNILHYINNNQRFEDGDMVLVDAGCEFNGYCADITRTWPINGRFTKEQRTIYEIVLHVQEACIQLCTPGNNLDNIYGVMLHLLARELAQSDVFVEKMDGKQIYQFVREYCPHHVGHWLGMDVHDTSVVPRSTTFVPGMVITIEPGLYLQSNDSRINPKYRGIAVRIEDDVMITSKSGHVLTSNCPKHVDDIEKLMTSSSAS